MRFLLNIYIYILLVVCLLGCTEIDRNPSIDTSIPKSTITKSSVDEKVRYFTLKHDAFEKEILANGKLSSALHTNLKFSRDGIIQVIACKEGDYVQKGQLIAELDNKLAKLSLRNTEVAYQQARLDYEDQLLRLGFKAADTISMPLNMKNIARIRSGLAKIETDLSVARLSFQETVLSAPFNGKIANLRAKKFNNSFGYDYICTLVDDTNMEVVFKILEQELSFLKQIERIEVIPFYDGIEDGKIYAQVKSINPLVDSEGMIEVRAQLKRSYKGLMDGMNVKIRAIQLLNNQFVVPKTAVLNRQERKVIFTLVDNKAQWNYVEIGGENKDKYLITSGLNVGDKVIYTGNFNLSHDKPVIE